jgi:NAD(P) transhydrogenase subunit beta
MLFVVGLKMLSSPGTARRGNLISAAGMLLAVVATLWHRDIIGFGWIATGLAVGTVLGVIAARVVAMSAMPEMVAGPMAGSMRVRGILVRKRLSGSSFTMPRTES